MSVAGANVRFSNRSNTANTIQPIEFNGVPGGIRTHGPQIRNFKSGLAKSRQSSLLVSIMYLKNTMLRDIELSIAVIDRQELPLVLLTGLLTGMGNRR